MVSEAETLGERIAEQAAHLDAATHRLLADLRAFDASGEWYRQGARSCAHWLSWRVGWGPAKAREHVRVARRLGELPLVDEALRRGELSYCKVRAITRVATPANEAELLEQARHATGADLEKICRKYAMVVRAASSSERDERSRRTVWRRELEDGMVRIEATLHAEEAAIVWAALEKVARERYRTPAAEAHTGAPEDRAAAAVVPPCVPAGPDTERVARGDEKALGVAHDPVVDGASARTAAAQVCAGEAGGRGASMTTLSSASSPSEASGRSQPSGQSEARSEASGPCEASERSEASGQSEASCRSEAAGPSEASGRSEATGGGACTTDVATRVVSGIEVDDAVGVGSCVDESRGHGRDAPVGAARRGHPAFDRADALLAIAQAILRGRSVDRSPTELVVTVSAETLLAPHTEPESFAALADGTCVSAETARRLACDCGVVYVHEDVTGQVLSVGRKTRSIPVSIKRALLRRDRTCRFPGCGNRLFLEGHHIEHWADGGETSLGNLVGLCGHHHRFLHEYGYQVFLDEAGQPVFLDPHGRPVRDVPPRPAPPDLGWPAISRANQDLGITPRTGECLWDGLPVDYVAAIDELVRLDGLI